MVVKAYPSKPIFVVTLYNSFSGSSPCCTFSVVRISALAELEDVSRQSPLHEKGNPPLRF